MIAPNQLPMTYREAMETDMSLKMKLKSLKYGKNGKNRKAHSTERVLANGSDSRGLINVQFRKWKMPAKCSLASSFG